MLENYLKLLESLEKLELFRIETTIFVEVKLLELLEWFESDSREPIRFWEIQIAGHMTATSGWNQPTLAI